MLRLSDLPTAPVNGFISPIRMRKVRTTAKCASILFPFLKPGVIRSRIIPAMTGIRAVTEGVSDEKYAQLPRVIRTKALIRFTKYGFITDGLP